MGKWGQGYKDLSLGMQDCLSVQLKIPSIKNAGKCGHLGDHEHAEEIQYHKFKQAKGAQKGTLMEVQLFLECLLNILWKCCSVVLICIGCSITLQKESVSGLI